jgi:hypothetical protein
MDTGAALNLESKMLDRYQMNMRNEFFFDQGEMILTT